MRFSSKLARGKRRARGIMLVELMFSIAVVAMGSVATITMLTFARMQNKREMERARAHQIVSQQLEFLKYDLATKMQVFPPGQQQMVIWDNGTPTDLTDDTQGALSLTATTVYAPIYQVDKNDYTKNPFNNAALSVPFFPLLKIEATMTWTPRDARTDPATNQLQQVSETIVSYFTANN